MDWPPQYPSTYTPPAGQEFWCPELETMAPKHRDSIILEKLRGQVSYAITHSGFYQEFYQDAAVDPANLAGFTNSGESLSMTPALFKKYLAAAQHVSEHLVLVPSGFTFAPHPAVTASDRDKFTVRRIVDFYLAQNTDYSDFLLAAWQLRHRERLGKPELTLAEAAMSRGVFALICDDQEVVFSYDVASKIRVFPQVETK